MEDHVRFVILGVHYVLTRIIVTHVQMDILEIQLVVVHFA
jgi:hypothetical protein